MAALTSSLTQERKRLHGYREEAAKFKRWSKRWRKLLLTRYAPRVAELGDGHLTKKLGGLLVALSEPWAPTMGNLDKCIDRVASNVTTEILVELFVEDVRKAERSAHR